MFASGYSMLEPETGNKGKKRLYKIKQEWNVTVHMIAQLPKIHSVHVESAQKSKLLPVTAVLQLCNCLVFCQVTQKQTLSKQIESGKPAFNLSCDNQTCYHLLYKLTFLYKSLASISKYWQAAQVQLSKRIICFHLPIAFTVNTQVFRMEPLLKFTI